MEDLNEIIRDLNVTIADTETLMARENRDNNDYKRAIGQLKAARTSLVNAMRESSLKGNN